MSYIVSDPVPGTLVIYLDRNVITGMTLNLERRLEKRDIVARFGSDYATVRYATDDCLTEAGTAPLYEDPEGSIEHMEYRDRGLAAIIQENKVVAIAFVSKPYGPVRSQCGGRQRRR